MTPRWLGWIALLASGIILFIWIPLDVDTGIIEKVRRQVILGDAFAPSIAAALIGLGGLLILFERKNSSADANQPEAHRGATLNDLKHSFILLGIASVSLILMRYTGPMVLGVIEGSDAEYRLLRDTAPWKYIGFVTGGMCLIVSLIAFTERRLRWQHFLIALLAVLALIAFYDLPFEDLLLPPNGDV